MKAQCFVNLTVIPISAKKRLKFFLKLQSQSLHLKRPNNISNEMVTVANIATKRLKILFPSDENRGECVSSSDSDSEFFPFNQPGCRVLFFLFLWTRKSQKEKEDGGKSSHSINRFAEPSFFYRLNLLNEKRNKTLSIALGTQALTASTSYLGLAW